MGRIQLGLSALKNFNGGVEKFQSGRWTFVLKNPMGVLKRVNGGIEKIRWGVNGHRGHGERVNGGIERSGSMGVLKRVNGGVGQGQ